MAQVLEFSDVVVRRNARDIIDHIDWTVSEDERWVVLGPKNRVHIFNDSGLHITSVVYPPETVRHRTTKGKWLRPEPEALQSFRKALRRTDRG